MPMQPRLLTTHPNHTGYLTIYMHLIKSPKYHHNHHILYSLSQTLPALTSVYYTSHLYPITPLHKSDLRPTTPIPPSINNPTLQLPIRLLQIIIHNNNIMYVLLLGKLHLGLRLLQPLLQAFFVFRTPAPQPLFQNFDARWREEEETGVKVSAFDLFDALRLSVKEPPHRSSLVVRETPWGRASEYRDSEERRSGKKEAAHLHLDIQNTNPPLGRYIPHRLHTSAVVIPAKLRMLNEAALIHKPQEGVFGRKVIFDAVFLAGPGRSCSIYPLVVNSYEQGGRKKEELERRPTRDGKAERVGVVCEEAFEEGGFAGARGAGDDDWAVLLYCLGYWSMAVGKREVVEVPVGAIVLLCSKCGNDRGGGNE